MAEHRRRRAGIADVVEVAARGQELPFVQAIRFGETMRRVAGATQDASEGRTAFREKRPPQWQGK